MDTEKFTNRIYEVLIKLLAEQEKVEIQYHLEDAGDTCDETA